MDDAIHDQAGALSDEILDRSAGSGLTKDKRRPVGAKLKQLQDRLLELGDKLMRETDADATALVSKALEAVQSQRLSISVIGQVNAGKTSLVNALARQPELLPVAQVPWTAAITRLHFGLHGFPDESSHFRFFDDEEWRRLAEQGGRLRELAERFLPGFNSEQLRQQVQAMRHRAEARLGPAFKDLLGSTHSFATLEPEVVAQYVSAGDVPQPNYADITRVADLFFKLEPFGYPLTLIDTPGTNDPFLVREEITLRSLDASDACIVVVDATKGITDADLGLFRILRGVNTQRLILFVNKADALQGSPADAGAVGEQIGGAVLRELGSSQIPVIIGSAHACGEIDDAGPAPDDGSGLGQLEDALTALIHQGHSAHYVHQASATLMTLADGVRSQAAVQLAELQGERAADKARFDNQVARAREVAFSQDLSDQIARTTSSAIASLQRISGAYEKQALANLQHLVESFAASQKEEFLKQHPTKLPAKTLRFDTNGLRQRILVAHTQEYRRVRREMTNALRVAAARLTFLIDQTRSDVKVGLDFNAVSEDFVYPSQAPLGQALAIDLEEPFWRRWWRRRVTPQEAAESLEALIVQEFLPVVEQLVANNKGELDSEIDYSVLQLSINGTHLTQSLKNTQIGNDVGSRDVAAATSDLALAKDDGALVKVTVPGKAPVDPQRWQHRFDIAQSRHRRADILVREFAALADDCQQLLA